MVWRRTQYKEVQCHLAFCVLSCCHVLPFMTCMALLMIMCIMFTETAISVHYVEAKRFI